VAPPQIGQDRIIQVADELAARYSAHESLRRRMGQGRSAASPSSGAAKAVGKDPWPRWKVTSVWFLRVLSPIWIK
jgi:hypothetical protein